MEHARYWMWTKRKHGPSSDAQTLTNPSYDDSWEEQAFAEDAAGPLGGCIWPPRSYSCSFCRREFRSAQALGGHMNVHRRDRARLKQSISPHNDIFHHPHQNNHNHVQNPCRSFGVPYPSQACTMVCNPKNNSDFGVLASPSSPSRVSTPPTQENPIEQTLVPPPFVQGHHERSSFSSPPPWSNLVTRRYLCASDSITEGDKSSIILESGCKSKGDCVKPDLSVSLNLFVCRAHPSVLGDKEETAISFKRRRTDAFLKPSSVDRHHAQSGVLEVSASTSSDDLDLELRLGDRPKGVTITIRKPQEV